MNMDLWPIASIGATAYTAWRYEPTAIANPKENTLGRIPLRRIGGRSGPAIAYAQR